VYVAKKLTQAQANRLLSKGARVINDKVDITPAPVSIEITEAQRMAAEATARAVTAEQQATKAADLATRQMDQMQALIDKMPTHVDAPPITGFEFIRDDKGYSTGVTFIRSKRVLN
jgi:hypothetical protein